MAEVYIPQDNIKFYRADRDHDALFEYKEHSKALQNANEFRMAQHIHPSAELLFVTAGRITLSISGRREETIGAGEAALIIPFQPHGYSRERGTEYFRFNFSTFLAKSFFKSNESTVGERAVFRPDPEDSTHFLERLKRRERPPVYKIKSFLYSIISDYLDQVRMVEKSVDENILTRIIFFMDQHKKEPLSMADVAAYMGYNEKYLSRYINKASGLSFTTLLSTLRMDDARIMLMETDKTILEIAMDCGFGTERTFYRHFKNLLGMSPKSYRKKNNRPATVDNEVLI